MAKPVRREGPTHAGHIDLLGRVEVKDARPLAVARRPRQAPRRAPPGRPRAESLATTVRDPIDPPLRGCDLLSRRGRGARPPSSACQRR